MAYYVTVINQTMSGVSFVEGRARVLKTIDGDKQLVDFGDGIPVVRFVDPEAQSDPAAYVARLNDAQSAEG